MAQRPGWVRLRGGCGGVWQHESGWQVQHCGHPTALWPYFGVPPGGGPMLLDDNGRGFGKLAHAQEAVERKVAEQSAAHTPGGSTRPLMENGHTLRNNTHGNEEQ